MSAFIELSDPVDTLSPLTVRIEIDGTKRMWISPARNYCTGWTYMDECGRVHFTLIAYRTATLRGNNDQAHQ